MSSTPQQAQAAVIFCESNRVLLEMLIDEIEKRLKAYAATTLLYGLTVKCHDVFIVVEAAKGIPLACLRWFREDRRIIDYIVFDVPSPEQERQAQEEAQAAQVERAAQILLEWVQAHSMRIVPGDEHDELRLVPNEEEGLHTTSEEQERPSQQDEAAAQGQQTQEEPRTTMQEKTTKGARCSCCSKEQGLVSHLYQPDGERLLLLCNECVEGCLLILQDEGIATDAVPPAQQAEDPFSFIRAQYSCSFCGKKQEQVARLIALLNGLFICNGCVGKCAIGVEEPKERGEGQP
jgi:ClpX C4-type zinc finger